MERWAKSCPTRGALDPIWIAEKLGGNLYRGGRNTDGIKAGKMKRWIPGRRADTAEDIAAACARTSVAGCPHNSSNQLQKGKPRLWPGMRLPLYGAMDGPRDRRL